MDTHYGSCSCRTQLHRQSAATAVLKTAPVHREYVFVRKDHLNKTQNTKIDLPTRNPCRRRRRRVFGFSRAAFPLRVNDLVKAPVQGQPANKHSLRINDTRTKKKKREYLVEIIAEKY